MIQATARSLIAKTLTLLARLDAVERIAPVLSENDLADPDLEIDASMDHRIPGNASADLLRQAQRCLFRYIAWLDNEALPRHPSFAKDEISRAVRRLAELEVAAKAARQTLQ
jgi:hypothetical protein